MKYFFFLVLILALVFFAGSAAYQYGFSAGVQSVTDTAVEIDRSPVVKYPLDEYEGRGPVMIELYDDGGYYHTSIGCHVLDFTFNGFIKVLEYEALERGFLPCPNCVYPEVKVAK